MTTATQIREKLDTLRNATLALSDEVRLGPNNTIPSNFLTEHGIKLEEYHCSTCETEEGNLSQKPPVFFLPRSSQILKDYPNDYARLMEGHLNGATEPEYPTYQGYDLPDARHTSMSPWNRSRIVADYLVDWVFGDYRHVPDSHEDLADVCGIKPIKSVLYPVKSSL